jgi:hypothetical protein
VRQSVHISVPGQAVTVHLAASLGRD